MLYKIVSAIKDLFGSSKEVHGSSKEVRGSSKEVRESSRGERLSSTYNDRHGTTLFWGLIALIIVVSAIATLGFGSFIVGGCLLALGAFSIFYAAKHIYNNHLSNSQSVSHGESGRSINPLSGLLDGVIKIFSNTPPTSPSQGPKVTNPSENPSEKPSEVYRP